MPTKEKIKKAVAEIETLYREYINQINTLKTEQTQILTDFLHKLESKKLEEIRSFLKNYNA